MLHLLKRWVLKMAGHNIECNTERNMPCDCYLSRRQPIARTWFATGKAHYEADRPCDERYPLEYVKGYADAANIVGIVAHTVPIYQPFDETSKDYWQADRGDDHARGSSQAQAGARLVNYIVRKRDAADEEGIARGIERAALAATR